MPGILTSLEKHFRLVNKHKLFLVQIPTDFIVDNREYQLGESSHGVPTWHKIA